MQGVPSPGNVLDDPNSSTNNGTGIEQWQFNGNANQEWITVTLADGNVLIVNEASGEVLGDPGFSKSNGTGIIQWQLNDGMNEQWQLVGQANGSYGFRNAYSRLWLGDPGFSTSKGTQVVQWQWTGGRERAVVTVLPDGSEHLMVTGARRSEGPGLQRSGPS